MSILEKVNSSDSSSVALYRQISEQILGDIRSGHLGLGDKLPSQAELQKKYDVSTGTIRQSLSALERMGIIRREHGRGNFVSLQSRRPRDVTNLHTVGLIFEHYNAPENTHAQNALILAFKETCRQKGVRLLYAELKAGKVGCSLVDTFERSHIDGICMFLQEPEKHEAITYALQHEFPSAVTLTPGLVNQDMPTDLIEVDNKVGVRQAMKYLFSMGHRRIGYVGSAIADCLTGNPYVTSGRWQAYESEIKQAGIPIDPKVVVEIPFGQEPNKTIDQQIINLVKGENPVSAIFAQNDWMARYIMNVLWHAGIYVPRDVSLVGFDNIVFSLDLVPALTTVAFPFVRIAEVTLDLIEQRLKQPDRPVQKVILPTELVIRETVANVLS